MVCVCVHIMCVTYTQCKAHTQCVLHMMFNTDSKLGNLKKKYLNLLHIQKDQHGLNI